MIKSRSAEYISFLRELPGSFEQIGGLVPSSRLLTRAMLRHIEPTSARPLRILEAGPGTGPFTREILKRMGPQDSFVICEINQSFLDQLHTRLLENEDFRRNKDRVEFYLGSVESLPLERFEGYFDVIVSSLPFSNFSAELVESLLNHYKSLLAEDGTLTMLEYVGIRRISRLVSTSKKRRARMRAVEQVVQECCSLAKRKGEFERSFAPLNVPPAMALHLTLNKSVAEESLAA